MFVEVSPGNESIYVSTCLCKISFPENMVTLDYEDFRNVFSVLIQDNSFNCVQVIRFSHSKENPMIFLRNQSLEVFEIGYYCYCCFH